MQTTETTTDFATAARANIFARMIHGLTADGDARPAFEQAKRVAQAVRTDRQRAILWSHQTLNHEAVTWEILIVLGVDQLGAQRVVRQGGAPPCRRGTGPMTTRTKKHEGNDEHEGDEEEQGEHDEQEGNEAAFAAGGGRTRIWCAGSSMTAAARDAERRIEARIAEQASSQNSPHRTHGWFFPRRRRLRIARCRPGTHHAIVRATETGRAIPRAAHTRGEVGRTHPTATSSRRAGRSGRPDPKHVRVTA